MIMSSRQGRKHTSMFGTFFVYTLALSMQIFKKKTSRRLLGIIRVVKLLQPSIVAKVYRLSLIFYDKHYQAVQLNRFFKKVDSKSTKLYFLNKNSIHDLFLAVQWSYLWIWNVVCFVVNIGKISYSSSFLHFSFRY